MDRRLGDERAFDVDRRSEGRLVAVVGGWLVCTREGDRGPFPSRAAAEQEAAAYVETMLYVARHDVTIPADIDRREVEIVDLRRLPWS